MIVATLQVELHVHGAGSLKDKRRVVRSVKDRLHREHQASVAEIGALESLTVARLGVAVVGSDGKYLAGVLDRITEKLRALTDAEVGATRREMMHAEAIAGAVVDDTIDEDAIAAELLRHAGSIGGDGDAGEGDA